MVGKNPIGTGVAIAIRCVERPLDEALEANLRLEQETDTDH
jgi:hypothetical protein